MKNIKNTLDTLNTVDTLDKRIVLSKRSKNILVSFSLFPVYFALYFLRHLGEIIRNISEFSNI